MNPLRHTAPSQALLADYFAKARLPLSKRQIDLFWSFHQLLRKRNVELNLTRLHAFETMVVKHYLDCALVPTLTDLPSPLMDIGSGAGFPGIPLKIMHPEIKIILAEGRKNRVAFLREAIELLEIEGIEIHSGRIYPDTCLDPPIHGIITRAVETMNDTLTRVTSCLQAGGQAIFMKGPGGASEIKETLRHHPDYRLVTQKAYTLPRLGDERLVVVFERRSKPNRRTQPPPIASADNDVFKKLMTLQTSKGIRKCGEFMTGGSKLLMELIREKAADMTSWIGTPDMLPPPEEAVDCRWIVLSGQRFHEVNILGTQGPLVTLRLPSIPEFDPQAPWPDGCTLFIPFGDPENVGAVIRAAAGLGAARVVVLRDAAFPFLPKALRASAGALWKIRLESGPFLKDLTTDGAAPLFALDATGTPLDHIERPARYGLVAGMEGPGLPDEIRERARLVSIPLSNGVESLNAATAAAIALWNWRSDLKITSADSRPIKPVDSG
ncbi:MAG: 16S rRNA (guanine(527)-N(7))-methyltransferase RsmG [Verrucomicrobia bacterium]|nr:16S rRNA (guanine(527)-N(7))-methyltransferase RsmG [Verrucomicrobiota bacterium]MCG2681719.1 16S rRNA (guanine(527)-N(7))-methyltransferase RsmG [Kiritimatiellia bacterium]MBU4247180.1 16S rRNA (guanine(527)-N(7))-methyltransferase RsmG [Verrucomicrobiota bacterium]MBU4291399.1 16S rRNA (guanine(527)-N(7))-methyltransferase RsmG [Verrucomicrobiota bacterium]MBU4428567.1 16S rRNA (guanine(527)-N(7))-methyltransferase RsmG [Verrucomicrobiota bacterium]